MDIKNYSGGNSLNLNHFSAVICLSFLFSGIINLIIFIFNPNEPKFLWSAIVSILLNVLLINYTCRREVKDIIITLKNKFK